MCDSCGCRQPEEPAQTEKVVDVQMRLLAANDAQAQANRRHIEQMGALALNLISSPGSGKTSLLEQSIERLKDRLRIAVIEGDPETERDAERIRRKGVPAVQLTTGGGCHLDAPMVLGGLQALERMVPEPRFDLIFIENVGNLVCPAAFDLGEHLRVVLLSVPEGSDKPAKYPATFRSADLLLLTKTDLLPHFDFSLDEARAAAALLRPGLEVLALSAEKGEGMDAWIDYLLRLVRR